MAKRSKSQTELTINQIMDEAFKQIIAIGFDVMSYTTLSEATGISRTGISHHFPKKTDFLVKLDARIGKLFTDPLDFSSTDALKISWQEADNNDSFRAVLALFFSLCGNNNSPIKQFQAITQSIDTARAELGEVGEATINHLIGQSAIKLLSS